MIVGIFIFKMYKCQLMKKITILALAALAVTPMVYNEIFAEDDQRLKINAVVLNIEREHGIYSDKITLTTSITNKHSVLLDSVYATYIGGAIHNFYPTIWPCESNYEFNDVRIPSKQTKEITSCFIVPYNMNLDVLEIRGSLVTDEFYDPFRYADIAFTVDEFEYCKDIGEVTCLKQYNIEQVIENVESEPMTCEVNPVPLTNPITESDIETSGIYYRSGTLNDIVIYISGMIGLTEDWYDHAILDITYEGDTTQYGLSDDSESLITSPSSSAWIDIGFSDFYPTSAPTVAILTLDPGSVGFVGDIVNTEPITIPLTIIP